MLSDDDELPFESGCSYQSGGPGVLSESRPSSTIRRRSAGRVSPEWVSVPRWLLRSVLDVAERKKLMRGDVWCDLCDGPTHKYGCPVARVRAIERKAR